MVLVENGVLTDDGYEVYDDLKELLTSAIAVCFPGDESWEDVESISDLALKHTITELKELCNAQEASDGSA